MMKPEIIFAVGSENPVKIGCVTDAAGEFWEKCTIIGVETESGVSAQPLSDEEMLRGSINRARDALNKIPDATFGVGIEGGVNDTGDGLWAYAWVAIIDRFDRVGKGQSGRFLLPEAVAALVRQGMELGEADDRFFGRNNSKQKEGAIGILSDGKIKRLDLYKPAVTFALLRFVHPEYYEA